MRQRENWACILFPPLSCKLWNLATPGLAASLGLIRRGLWIRLRRRELLPAQNAGGRYETMARRFCSGRPQKRTGTVVLTEK